MLSELMYLQQTPAVGRSCECFAREPRYLASSRLSSLRAVLPGQTISMRKSIVAAQFDQWLFSSPVPLCAWTPVQCAALYAILASSQEDMPFPFKVIYFGEAESLGADFFVSHPRYGNWVRQAGSEMDLYVSTYMCAGMSLQYREFVTSMLIRQYQPACNEVMHR